MRVLLDVNIYISFLLSAKVDSAVAHIVRAGIAGHYTVLIADALLEELVARVPNKPYLSQRITTSEIDRLVQILRLIGEIIPAIEAPIPAVTRDAKDDYLLAYAAVGRADYLVTGDEDLLVLGRAAGVAICRPRAFWEILSAGRT